jgi:hypothetical protein
MTTRRNSTACDRIAACADEAARTQVLPVRVVGVVDERGRCCDFTCGTRAAAPVLLVLVLILVLLP